MLLFLDIDGVLHPHVVYDQGLLLTHRPALEAVLRALPVVDIVISSTWRTTRTLAELRALFSEDIAPRIVSVTPQWTEVQGDDSWGTYVRQSEIEAWLRANGRPWEEWVALDDQPALFRPFCKNLVRTCAETGLDEATCVTLLERLKPQN
ncbi:HAD domain-containing protein [Duganella violaceipulchra]|uniref:Uncharacterized protein n=1 Tax=Duganella violaceipulchra TaxID=2849652 RepID=A0AA41L3U7_9BURK|nr:hypothetical protein [Duganella violaceicalia]